MDTVEQLLGRMKAPGSYSTTEDGHRIQDHHTIYLGRKTTHHQLTTEDLTYQPTEDGHHHINSLRRTDTNSLRRIYALPSRTCGWGGRILP